MHFCARKALPSSPVTCPHVDHMSAGREGCKGHPLTRVRHVDNAWTAAGDRFSHRPPGSPTAAPRGAAGEHGAGCYIRQIMRAPAEQRRRRAGRSEAPLTRSAGRGAPAAVRIISALCLPRVQRQLPAASSRVDQPLPPWLQQAQQRVQADATSWHGLTGALGTGVSPRAPAVNTTPTTTYPAPARCVDTTPAQAYPALEAHNFFMTKFLR